MLFFFLQYYQKSLNTHSNNYNKKFSNAPVIPHELEKISLVNLLILFS